MDRKKVEDRAWMLKSIARLMAVGVKLPPRAAAWLVQQRDKFFLDPKAVPGGAIRDRMRRLLIEAKLEPRPALRRRMAERGLHVPEQPRASAPSGLQGSRTPTPMQPWLIDGRGLPLKPPTRRAVST